MFILVICGVFYGAGCFLIELPGEKVPECRNGPCHWRHLLQTLVVEELFLMSTLLCHTKLDMLLGTAWKF